MATTINSLGAPVLNSLSLCSKFEANPILTLLVPVSNIKYMQGNVK